MISEQLQLEQRVCQLETDRAADRVLIQNLQEQARDMRAQFQKFLRIAARHVTPTEGRIRNVADTVSAAPDFSSVTTEGGVFAFDGFLQQFFIETLWPSLDSGEWMSLATVREEMNRSNFRPEKSFCIHRPGRRAVAHPAWGTFILKSRLGFKLVAMPALASRRRGNLNAAA